ncbi:MAG TPA: thioredoxin domain-containing protein [Flavobacterium sp.]|jgi:thioredoxin
MKKLLAFILASAFFISCNSNAQNGIETIPPKAYADKLKATPDAQLLDVRTPEEYSSEHLDNAENVNLNGDDFEKEVAKYDKSKPVFVYCKIGGRSRQAAAKLHDMGFSEVYDLQGGILKWNAEGFSKPAGKGIGMSGEEYSKLINSDKKVLVNFYAEWCAPCKKMTPYMAELEKNSKDVKVVRLDANKNKSLISEMKMDELPVILLYENGKVKWQHKGYISENDLKKQLQ